MLRLFIISLFIIPGFLYFYNENLLNNYSVITNSSLENINIKAESISYIHSRLDQRLSYEDEFINNFNQLDETYSSFHTLPFKIIAEVKDNIYLIETKYDWLWGDSRYSIFLIKINNNNLILIDYYIPDSINDPMEFYKVVNEGVEVISKSEKLLLNI